MITNEDWSAPEKDAAEQLIRTAAPSKAKLAKMLGVTTRAVEKWANGQNKMSFSVWYTIRSFADEASRKAMTPF